jgi:RHS repeat-associated protein
MLGQRVSMTASVPAQGLSNHLTAYEYDPLYQLVKATYPNVAPFNGEVDSWTYDAIGNRLTNTVNGTAQAYTYQKITGNPNNWQRLLSDGANNYTYDLDGNAASRSGSGGTFNFTWSDQDRLITITGGVAAAYNYDWQGRRYIKQVAGASTSHLYSGLNLIQEPGASPADYLFGPGIDEALAMSRGGQTYYYLTDAIGSGTAISNTVATVQNSYLYDAWGQVKSQTGSLTNPFTYTSREAAEAGLSFYRARYYQPSLGRFLTEDPATGGNEPNLYAYVGNASLLYVDPTGMERVNCCTWDLADAKRNAERRLALLKTSGTAEDPAKSAKIGSQTVCATITIVDPATGRSVTIGQGRTTNFDRFDDAPCPFLCRQAHEARHRSDCERKARQYKVWSVAEREIPGYEEELRCLNQALAQGYLDVGGFRVHY